MDIKRAVVATDKNNRKRLTGLAMLALISLSAWSWSQPAGDQQS